MAESAQGILVGKGEREVLIRPDMATMLAFVFCDAAIEPALLRKALTRAVDRTFNMITVDGDTSTSDSLLLVATGKAGNPPITSADAAGPFREALHKVMLELAHLVVRDGEGATRIARISVTGARSLNEARAVARAIACSSLVKTALAGGDPTARASGSDTPEIDDAANALNRLDELFLQEPADPNYQARRDNTLIISLGCATGCSNGLQLA